MLTIPNTFRFENGQFVPHEEELFFPHDEDEEEPYDETLERWGFSRTQKRQTYGGGTTELEVSIRAATDMRRPGQEFGYLVDVNIAETYQHVLCRTLPDLLALMHYLTPMLQLGISEWYNMRDIKQEWDKHLIKNPPMLRKQA